MRLLTKAQEKSLSKHWARQHHKDLLRSFETQQEEETMNDNLNDNVGNTDGKGYTEFKPVPTQLKFTDKELEQLLEGKPFDGQVAYLTDADETDDGLADFGPETKTIH